MKKNKKSDAIKVWNKIDKAFGVYGGGAVQWKDMVKMEHIKDKMGVLYHADTFQDSDGKRVKILIVTVGIDKGDKSF